MGSRLVKLFVRAGILFALSMVLVLGFWEHRNFYQFGLPVLLVGGGLVTFLVILAFRVALSGQFPGRWARGEIGLSDAEVEGLRRGTSELLIRNAVDPGLPLLGSVVRGRSASGKPVFRLRIADGTRKLVTDVTDEEARRAGYASAVDAARTARADRPDDLVAILQVEILGGTHD